MSLETDINNFISLSIKFKKLSKEAEQKKIKVYSIYEVEPYERGGSQGKEFVRRITFYNYESAVDEMKKIYENENKNEKHSYLAPPQLLLVQEILAANGTYFTMDFYRASKKDPSEGEYLYVHPDTKEKTLIKVTNVEPGIEYNQPTATADIFPPNFKQFDDRDTLHIYTRQEETENKLRFGII